MSADAREDVADGVEPFDPCAAASSSCSEAIAELELFLDGELPNETVESISSHFDDCFSCADRAAFENELRTAIRNSCSETAPQDLLAKVRACLDTADQAGS